MQSEIKNIEKVRNWWEIQYEREGNFCLIKNFEWNSAILVKLE